MAGLLNLDFLSSSDPQQQAENALMAGLLGGRGSFNNILGGAVNSATSAGQKATVLKRQGQLDELQRQRFQLMLDEEARRKKQFDQQEAFRRSIPSPEMAGVQGALAGGGGPTLENAAKIPPVDPSTKLAYGALQAGVLSPTDWLNMQRKDRTPIKGSQGDVFFDPQTFKQVASVAPKPESTPGAIQEYQFAQNQGYKGTFDEWDQARRKAGASNVSVNTGEKGFKNELALKQDFRQEPIYKDYQDMQTAYKQVQGAIKQGTPIADTAAATKIMKLLDPGSTVRESELGLAMAATGKMDRLKNYFQMQLSGNKLTPQMRQDFSNLADEFYDAAGLTYNQKRAEYEGVGKRYQLDTSGLGPVHKPVKAMKSIRDQADAIIGQ